MLVPVMKSCNWRLPRNATMISLRESSRAMYPCVLVDPTSNLDKAPCEPGTFTQARAGKCSTHSLHFGQPSRDRTPNLIRARCVLRVSLEVIHERLRDRAFLDVCSRRREHSGRERGKRQKKASHQHDTRSFATSRALKRGNPGKRTGYGKRKHRNGPF